MIKKQKYRTLDPNLQTKSALLFFSPAIIMLSIFTVIPVVIAVIFSFTDVSMTGANSNSLNFIGFKNFIKIFQDDNLRRAVTNTIIFTFFSAIVGQQILGFLLAYLMRGKSTRFRRIIGISILAGWVTPEIVAAFNLFAFFSDEGILNKILSFINIEPIMWLFTFPMVSVIMANIWRGTAFSMMIYEAALADIPETVEEAALIDGASEIKRIWHVILPMLKNTITTNMILVTLQTIGVFGLIFALTGGGPGMATQTLPIYMYNQAFISYQIGYGTAIALIMLALGVSISVLYIRSMKSEI